MRYTSAMKSHPPCAAAGGRTRRSALPAALLLAGLLAAGCASAPATTIALSYDALAASAWDGGTIDPAAIRQAFLVAPDFDERLRQLIFLEGQVLEVLDGEPLRLGAVGSAILDQYYASLTGHQALARFYRHLELAEQADRHDAWVEAIRADIESSAMGTTPADPYRALSANEAEAFLSRRGMTVMGASYYKTEDQPFLLQMVARAADGRVENVFFDLGDLYSAFKASVRRDKSTVFPILPLVSCDSTGPWCDPLTLPAFVHVLAQGGDSAAQVSKGRDAIAQNQFDKAIPWLHQASRSGNALASLLLAQLFERQVFQASSSVRPEWLEPAERNYRLAIAAGFDTAMADLGWWYLLGAYGEDRVSEGLPLLLRAADLNNIAALLRLGQLYFNGQFVEADHERSEQYYRRAAEQDERAKVEYARFLMSTDRKFDDRAWQWMREMAKDRNPDAMLVIGDMYARGVHVNKNVRRARSWFKNAAKTVPDDPHFVNEVAWRLTVSHLRKLRDERYALKIMDRVMTDENLDAHRNPAYLDTWAAAFAANGDFERAISVQEEAIERAVSSNDPHSALETLREHLETFRAGQLINDETVP